MINQCGFVMSLVTNTQYKKPSAGHVINQCGFIMSPERCEYGTCRTEIVQGERGVRYVRDVRGWSEVVVTSGGNTWWVVDGLWWLVWCAWWINGGGTYSLLATAILACLHLLTCLLVVHLLTCLLVVHLLTCLLAR